MSNPFGVFETNSHNMPGQGLASPDYNARQAGAEYEQMLQLYANGLGQFAPQLTRTRLDTLKTLLQGSNGTPGLSAQYLQAIRTADPDSARLLDSLTQNAESELALDNQLDPNQNRLVEQAVRGGAAARGLGYGPADVWAETFAKTGYGDQLREKRRANALTIQQLRQALASRPVDTAVQATVAENPEASMWQTLNNVYGNNQANARTKAELETKIGMHQADVWNGWFKTAAAAAAI